MRLKTLIAGLICTAALGSAAPAQAKSDSGNGNTQRCTAAQNGQHKGFTCEVVDDRAGTCSSGFTLVPASFAPPAVDNNRNGWVCRRS